MRTTPDLEDRRDNEDAKRQVTEFIEAIGYDVFDAGSLADSWHLQCDQAANAGALRNGRRLRTPGAPNRDQLQNLLDRETRTCTGQLKGKQPKWTANHDANRDGEDQRMPRH